MIFRLILLNIDFGEFSDSFGSKNCACGCEMIDLTLPCILVSQGPSKSGASSNRRASSNDLQKVDYQEFTFR